MPAICVSRSDNATADISFTAEAILVAGAAGNVVAALIMALTSETAGDEETKPGPAAVRRTQLCGLS
ncbi:MAG: hypothetical protein WBQ24_07980 [Xanthobacteraceae bacterium]